MNTQKKEDLGTIIDGECRDVLPAEVAPLTEPEQIEDANLKTAVLTLVQEKDPSQKEVKLYQIPPQPEVEDPRNPFRRFADDMALMALRLDGKLTGLLVRKIYGERVAILERIRAEKSIARAEATAAWLEEVQDGIKQSCADLCATYEEIALYRRKTQERLEQVRQAIQDGEHYLGNAPRSLGVQQKQLTSPEWYDSLVNMVGEKAAEQARKNTEDELQQQKNALAQDLGYTRRLIAFLRMYEEKYRGVVSAAGESLQGLERNIQQAGKQRLDLKQTLETYQGLTLPEARAAQALRFLQRVQGATAELKGAMQDIHGELEAASTSYEVNAPKFVSAPEPEHSEIAALQAKLLKQGDSS